MWFSPSLFYIVYIQYLKVNVENIQTSFKKVYFGRSLHCYVIGPWNVEQILIPSYWMLLIVTSWTLNQCLVHHLCLPIHLWMKSCRSLPLDVHLLSKCSPKALRNNLSLFKIMLLAIWRCTLKLSKNKIASNLFPWWFFYKVRWHKCY